MTTAKILKKLNENSDDRRYTYAEAEVILSKLQQLALIEIKINQQKRKL